MRAAVEDCFMEMLIDPVGLRVLGLCSGMVDILNGRIEFVFAPFRIAVVFRTAICPTTLLFSLSS